MFAFVVSVRISEEEVNVMRVVFTYVGLRGCCCAPPVTRSEWSLAFCRSRYCSFCGKYYVDKVKENGIDESIDRWE